MVAMAIGLGAALGLGLIVRHAALPALAGEKERDAGKEKERSKERFLLWPVVVERALWGVCGLWILCQLGEVVNSWATTHLVWTRAGSMAALVLAAVALVMVGWRRHRWAHRWAPIGLAVVVGLLPLPSVLSHWWSNEQQGHLFGYWFGHDMFAPPLRGADGRLGYDRAERARVLAGPERSRAYPEMARGAVLFGGTDPGRFCPTYMIFSESFLAPEKRRRPEFDRRDVYLITQNALADGHYLEYIRAHYNRSAQEDPYFFSELLRGPQERAENDGTNFLARLALPLDRALTQLGASVEQQRRAAGLYPAVELRLPTSTDLNQAMGEFMRDFQARAQRGELRPGEDVRISGDRAQVSGQMAVMGINAILTREIFEKNPTHEFYVEESFPLDWMYPHLTPFGIIMKIERTALAELGPEIVERDRRFWSDYLERLMGDWVKPDTNIAEICQYAERVHRRGDLRGYGGDLKFIRDEQAQKAFSKLRSSIGGVYDWRFRNATGQLQVVSRQLNEPGLDAVRRESLNQELRRLTDEQVRMYREGELAYKQAYALCPVSPEALQRLVNLLLAGGRVAEAAAIADTSAKLDPNNEFYTNVAAHLHRSLKAGGGA
jgi:hypothetical protein